MASFFAALRKDFPSTLALHACAEAVLLMTAAHMGLKRTFRQRFLSSSCILLRAAPLAISVAACGGSILHGAQTKFQAGGSGCYAGHPARIAVPGELLSVSDPRSMVKEGAHCRRKMRIAGLRKVEMSAFMEAGGPMEQERVSLSQRGRDGADRTGALVFLFVFSHLHGQIALVAKLLDLVNLGFEPVHVVLLILQEGDE